MIGLQELRDRMEVLYQHKNFLQIINALDDATLEHYADVQLYFYYGVACHFIGEHDKAIEHFTRAIGLDPRNPDGYNNRAAIWLFKKDNYKAIIDDLTTAIALGMETASVYFKRGIAWLNEHEYDKAINDLTQVLQFGDDVYTVLAYGNRANVWHVKEEYAKAVSDYSELIQLEPDDAENYSNRAVSLHEMGEEDKAIEDYNKAMTLDPSYVPAYINRGISLNRRKEYGKAISDFNEAIRLDPGYAVAYKGRAHAWYSKEEYDKAILDLTSAIALDPGDADLYNNRGEAHYARREYDKALGDYNEAIRLRPDNAPQFKNRGILWIDLLEYDKAMTDFSNAIELKPDYGEGYNLRAGIWVARAKYDKALEDFNKALEVEPYRGDTHFNLGQLYELVEKFNFASVYYKRGFSLQFSYKANLIEVFAKRLSAPYIVKTILNELDVSKVFNHLSAIEWAIASCEIWDSYLGYLQGDKIHKTHPEKYYGLTAIVNYYMGNCVEAYRIFNTQFESDEHPYAMTLRNYYYMALSAHDFLEPDDGLAFAIGQAEKEGNHDDISRYYAGRLYLLQNDLERALGYFDKCDDFIPALYAKAGIYYKQNDAGELFEISRKIRHIESLPENKIRISDGIGALVIRTGALFEEQHAAIMELLFYYESIEEIKEVRHAFGKDRPYRHLEFSELLELEPSFIDEMKVAPTMEELRLEEERLSVQLKANLVKLIKDDVYLDIHKNVDAGDEFKSLEIWVGKRPAMQSIEDILALRIYKHSIDINWYNKFSIYYFLEGAFDAKTVLRLYLYSIHISVMDYGSLPKDYKATISLVSELLNLLKLPIGYIYKIFSSILTSLHLNLQQEFSTDQSLEYHHFRQHYYQYLAFYKNTGLFGEDFLQSQFIG